MSSIEWNRIKIFVSILWIILLGTLIAFPLVEASANEVEDIHSVSAMEFSAQVPTKQKQNVDPFTIAIIGLSLGCMLIASSIHWNLTQRKELDAQIQKLDSFLADTCAVECHINGCNDEEPMVSSVKGLEHSRDMKIKEYEDQKNVMVRSITDVEADIMRIWG